MGYINAPDNLFNSKQVIKFDPIFASGQAVKFHAFVTDYSDNFESNWERDETYGRMDDIQTFQSTKRTIELAWQTVAASRSEAISNLRKVELLIQMLYPPYTHGGGQIFNINGSPVVRLKFMNLIQDARTGNGLMGSMSGLAATPDLELGFFPSDDNEKVYPKVIDLSCTFYPLHEHLLGWLGSNFNQDNFPYGSQGAGATATDSLENPAPPTLDGVPTGAQLSEAFDHNPDPAALDLGDPSKISLGDPDASSLGTPIFGVGLNSVSKEEVTARMNNTSKKKKKPTQTEQSTLDKITGQAKDVVNKFEEIYEKGKAQVGKGGNEDPAPTVTVTKGDGGLMINFGGEEEYSEGDHAIESVQAHFLNMGPLADD